MDLMTVQVGRWRLCQKHKAEFIDTTVKSGLRHFAPTWDLVLGIKNGAVSEEQYRSKYRQLMIDSWKANREQWEQFLRSEGYKAIACYCKPGEFCHRLLLVEIFRELCEKLQIPFNYYGELEP